MDYDDPDPRADAHVLCLAAIAEGDENDAARYAWLLATECRELGPDWQASREWGDEFFQVISAVARSLGRIR